MVGLDAQFGYVMAMAGEGNAEEPVYGSAFWKYDLRSGACTEHQLGAGVRGAEPVFAPANEEGGEEDEGWIISIVHDTNSDKSRLVIIDAQNFSAPPVATIHLPRRVPYGAHGSWVPDSAMV